MELGSHGEFKLSFASGFNSRFSTLVFVALFLTAVETAISEVHKLLGTGGVPTSLTWLFWRWLTVSSVFAGRSTWLSVALRPQKL